MSDRIPVNGKSYSVKQADECMSRPYCSSLGSDLYTPLRTSEWDRGDSHSFEERPKLKRSLKRPFIIDLGEQHKVLDYFNGLKGDKIIQRRWYHGFGCKVFDGLCISQTEFEEIDCAACVKSTFESFIKGCEHSESYIDQHGTRRCTACKDELGQDELDDPTEMDDFGEEDNPPEPDDPEEYSDPEIILNHSGMEHYKSWNLEGNFDQSSVSPAVPQMVPVTEYDPVWDRRYGGLKPWKMPLIIGDKTTTISSFQSHRRT